MLITAKTLEGYKLAHPDDEIGTVKEFYFDDHYWTIRYVVANTGNWLTGQKVLLSPYAVTAVVKEQHHIIINLTKQQIESSPSLSSDKPVCQQFELDYYGYYGWPTYWGGAYMWGAYPYLDPYLDNHQNWDKTTPAEQGWDPHLRSTSEVTGYHIQATDGELGHIEDFIIDEQTWAIRYLIVDTRNWWPGKKILLAPQWIDRVSWNESKVFVNLPRETIKQAPAYTEGSLLSRDYETSLHQYYDRPGYWEPTAIGTHPLKRENAHRARTIMHIGIAADHGGFELKAQLTTALKAAGYEVEDFGAHALVQGDDYPDFVVPLARAVARGAIVRGLAICGSGIGACVAANKVAGVRAALIADSFSAHQGVEDDDMNVMCLGGQVTGYAEAWELVQIFLRAHFQQAERFQRRLAESGGIGTYPNE